MGPRKANRRATTLICLEPKMIVEKELVESPVVEATWATLKPLVILCYAQVKETL